MAEIRNYMEERKKREKKSAATKEKITYRDEYELRRRLRLGGFLVAVILLVAAAFFGIHYYSSKTYVGYDTLQTMERVVSQGARDVRLGSSILTYSRDGAHCIDPKGVITWNQSFELQDLKVVTNQNAAAICGYNGHDIYVQNTESQLGQITTNLPIKDITVAGTGRVTAVLEDTDVVWLNTYEPGGQALYEGQYHMSQSGYPCAISLSPNGELLGASFLFVQEGSIMSNVTFFNYGPVGDNQSDQLVSAFTYQDMVIPVIQFMNNSTAFAVGDNRLMIYGGEQVPTTKAEHILDREVQAVYYSDKYIGLVFGSDQPEHKYMLKIYNTAGEEVRVHYFDREYLGIFFEKDTYTIYDASHCDIYTMSGNVKYEGEFENPISLMLPTDTPFRYRVVTDQSIVTIQLK